MLLNILGIEEKLTDFNLTPSNPILHPITETLHEQKPMEEPESVPSEEGPWMRGLKRAPAQEG